jgi:hypothetical protein
MNPADILPRRGRPPKSPISFEIVRNLEAEEVLLLAMGDRPQLTLAPLQRMREIHRKIALMMAHGHPDKEIALAVGRTPQSIRGYRNDPMMKDLIAYFASQREEIDLRVETQVRTDLVEIAQITTHEILDRLEDPTQRAKVPLGELRQLNEMALDRTVTPRNNPQPAPQIPTQITFNIKTNDKREIKEIEETPEVAVKMIGGKIEEPDE